MYGIGNGKVAEKFVEIIQENNLLDNNSNLHILDALFISLRTQSHRYPTSCRRLIFKLIDIEIKLPLIAAQDLSLRKMCTNLITDN